MPRSLPAVASVAVLALVCTACGPVGSTRDVLPPTDLAPSWGGVPLLDLAADTARQVVVDREPGQYLGHPTTVLLPDGQTIIAVYPKGHGRGAIVMKRSEDGGRTWSGRLPVPASWETSLEVPTIYRVDRADGGVRLLLFSGLYPIRMATSDDLGVTWSELEPIGDFGGIVAMAAMERRADDGALLAFFHDDGRFFSGTGTADEPFRVYTTRSDDDGLTWQTPVVIAEDDSLDLCEPGVFRSPDGARLAALLRENSRTSTSQVILSVDEGSTWSTPAPLATTVTGDRHQGVALPDGRFLVSFRDMADGSPTKGDWLAWVGTWDELVSGSPAGYRVRLMDNSNPWDSTYPGVVLLPDGTVVLTTYGHWAEGEEPYIVSVRLRVDELDRMVARLPVRP